MTGRYRPHHCSRLVVTGCSVQASVAAAASCVFTVGGVCAHQGGMLPTGSGSMLELVESHLHQNVSNLLAHVVQSAGTKDAMASLPPHVRPLPCTRTAALAAPTLHALSWCVPHFLLPGDLCCINQSNWLWWS